ncbi:MAG: enoyl-CoA hydratase/isomerase family protein [Pseudomonadales bacterium]
MTALIAPEQLLEMVAEPNLADAGIADVSALALDLRNVGFSEQEAREVRHWLARQPYPILGWLPETSQRASSQLIPELDLTLTSEAEIESVLHHIQRNPLATAVLAQVTRVTATLPIAAALAVESLGYATLQSGAEFARWLTDYQQTKKPSSTTDAQAPVLVEREGAVLRIQLNSPGNRNALSVSMRDGLTEAFKLVALDGSIERVVVSGTGSCFSAGGDLTEFGTAKDLAVAHHIRQLRMPAQYLAPHAARYCINVHGACIGAGIELPAFARRLTAKPDSFFQLPEIAMGLIPGAGGCVSIPRRIGRQRANYLAITGEKLSAERALSWGLIDEIVDQD